MSHSHTEELSILDFSYTTCTEKKTILKNIFLPSNLHWKQIRKKGQKKLPMQIYDANYDMSGPGYEIQIMQDCLHVLSRQEGQLICIISLHHQKDSLKTRSVRE